MNDLIFYFLPAARSPITPDGYWKMSTRAFWKSNERWPKWTLASLPRWMSFNAPAAPASPPPKPVKTSSPSIPTSLGSSHEPRSKHWRSHAHRATPAPHSSGPSLGRSVLWSTEAAKTRHSPNSRTWGATSQEPRARFCGGGFWWGRVRRAHRHIWVGAHGCAGLQPARPQSHHFRARRATFLGDALPYMGVIQQFAPFFGSNGREKVILPFANAH